MREDRIPKPAWLKRRLGSGATFQRVRSLIQEGRLHTVCQEALCPNQGECFSKGTATFLILGDHCTRNCGFCAVSHGAPQPPDPQEPKRVARAVKAMGIKYVVLTSVSRDDLEDGGAAQFAETIREIRSRVPEAMVEVLVPDFGGSEESLRKVLQAAPQVLNHNLETVPRLYPKVRPQAKYERSLELLERARLLAPQIPTKSGLMLGLGEEHGEVEQVLGDLLGIGCRLLTLGQYLRPSREHLPVERYVPPEEFDAWRDKALQMGFSHVASGPFVRSSYNAGEMYRESENRG
jgi:lipoic acid synthetase